MFRGCGRIETIEGTFAMATLAGVPVRGQGMGDIATYLE